MKKTNLRKKSCFDKICFNDKSSKLIIFLSEHIFRSFQLIKNTVSICNKGIAFSQVILREKPSVDIKPGTQNSITSIILQMDAKFYSIEGDPKLFTHGKIYAKVEIKCFNMVFGLMSIKSKGW